MIKNTIFRKIIISFILLSQSGCGFFDNSFEKIAEGYEIGWAEYKESMMIKSEYGATLVQPCVSSAGWDSEYIIAKRDKGNIETQEYYILKILQGNASKDSIEQLKYVYGPFTESEFKNKRLEFGVSDHVSFIKDYKRNCPQNNSKHLP